MVQSFEVQDEHSSSVRYIGTFTVQFRPNAVRDWLGKNGADAIPKRAVSRDHRPAHPGQ